MDRWVGMQRAVSLSTLVAALALAGGMSLGSALPLWFVLALQATTATGYVTTRLRLARGKTVRRASPIIAHFVALATVAGLAVAGLLGWLGVGVFGMLTVRTIWGLRPPSLTTPTPVVGVQEPGFSLLTVVSLALG